MKFKVSFRSLGSRLKSQAGKLGSRAHAKLRGNDEGRYYALMIFAGIFTLLYWVVDSIDDTIDEMKEAVDKAEGLGGGTTTPSFLTEHWMGIIIALLMLVGIILVARFLLQKRAEAKGKKSTTTETKVVVKKKDDSYHWYPFWAYWFYWPGLIGSYVWLVGYVMPRVLFLLPFNLNPVLSGIALALPFIGHARTLTDGNRKGPRPVVLGIGHVFSVLGVVVYLFIIFMTITGQLLWCQDVWGTGTCRFVGGLFGAIWTNVWL